MSNHNDTQDPNSGARTPREDSRKGTNSIVEFPEHKSIETQASEWLAKLDAEQPSAKVLSEFKRWVNADTAHSQAFEDMVEFWDEMNILTEAVLPREQLSRQELSREKLVNEKLANEKPRLFAKPRAAFATGMLTIAAVFTLAITISMQFGAPTIYITGIGEQQTIQLADNSTVQLNTNSRLEVDYSDNYRRLTLSHGEAHFNVAHNPDRPFEVYAGQGLVRAIGTAFTVHIRKIDIEVLVTEGTVELDHAVQPKQSQQPPRAPIINTSVVIATESNPEQTAQSFKPGLKVSAGNKVMYDKDLLDEVKLVVATQIEEQLSWRQGMLLFKGEPLQKVVDEVSRYTDLTIVIPERSARELKVGGLFKVGDTESLFEALRDGFGIHVKEVSSDVVYLISDKNR